MQFSGMANILESTAGKSLFMSFALSLATTVIAQERIQEYTIWQKETEIGQICFTLEATAQRTIFRLESYFEPRFAFAPSVKIIEEAVFENEVMVSSSIYRLFNEKEKLNTKTRLTGDGYMIYQGDETRTFRHPPITFNMLSLYAREPRDVAKVYSDGYQRSLDVEQLGQRHYRIRFPDGNYNEYFYEDGICIRINVYHALYHATIELNIDQ